jgi:hypothetical protein
MVMTQRWEPVVHSLEYDLVTYAIRHGKIPTEYRICRTVEDTEPEPQALDMPDGDGYWAFEGSIYAGEGVKNPKIAQYVCKVFMFHGTLTSWILEKGLWGIHHMHGKWYRLTMPWE